LNKKRKILHITPHQLSTEAKHLMRDGHSDFVKKMVGGGYYTGCKSVDNEVDIELFINIEKVNGEAFLTMQRGKHRGVNGTLEKDKYMVLPFPEEGRPILDDLDKEEITRSRVGGGAIGTKNEIPFFSEPDK
jgi:hypothetical protein